jgi:hypothetical protein
MQRIAEGVPIRAENFYVLVNGYRVTARRWTGNRIPVMTGTRYGVIHGEIVILPAYRASNDDMGFEIKVKGVTVRRELFEMASWGKAATRIRGEINADFLPLTSDRSGFIEDSPEYKAFQQAMKKTTAEVKRAYDQLASVSENQRIGRALKEALQRVHQALTLNPGFSPFGVLPMAEKGSKGIGEAGVVTTPGKDVPDQPEIEEIGEMEEPGSSSPEGAESVPEPKKPSLKIATPKAVVKRLKFGEAGVTCCLDHLGEDGPECMTEGTIIYINRDHPL